MCDAVPAFLELWDVVLYPSQDSSMRDVHTALCHHLPPVEIKAANGFVLYGMHGGLSALRPILTLSEFS